MRIGLLVLVLMYWLASLGCASKPEQPVSRLEAEAQYVDGGAATLVFDPPITQTIPRLNLSRHSREQTAFVGFDSSITTFFWVRTDDRQTEDHRNDRYERRAISEQVGVSYR